MSLIDTLKNLFGFGTLTIKGGKSQEEIDAQNKALQDMLAQKDMSSQNFQERTSAPSTSWGVYGRPEVNPYSQQIAQEFGSEAPNAERVLRWGEPTQGSSYGKEYGGENLNFDASATNQNKDQSTDYGLFMVNSNTLKDELTRNPEELQVMGISTEQDLLDPVKNIKFARYLQSKYGWGRWYGRPPDL